jgi:hypothetical protein
MSALSKWDHRGAENPAKRVRGELDRADVGAAREIPQRVVDRQEARAGLQVQQPGAHLAGDLAVPQQHGRVEHRATVEQSELPGSGLDSARGLERGEPLSGQYLVAVRFQFLAVVKYHRVDRPCRNSEVVGHVLGEQMQSVGQGFQGFHPVQRLDPPGQCGAHGLGLQQDIVAGHFRSSVPGGSAPPRME